MMTALLRLMLALPLTLAIEVPLSISLRIRNKSDVLLVAMVNCITNPVLNFALRAISMIIDNKPAFFFAVLVGEALVVLSEGWFFRRFLEEPPRRPFLCSLILNAASFLAGLLILS